jgi:hypothetical protein
MKKTDIAYDIEKFFSTFFSLLLKNERKRRKKASKRCIKNVMTCERTRDEVTWLVNQKQKNKKSKNIRERVSFKKDKSFPSRYDLKEKREKKYFFNSIKEGERETFR